MHSRIPNHLNWIIFLLFNPLLSGSVVSFGLHPSHWLVWLMDWFEVTDLPQLQSVKLGDNAFGNTRSFAMSNLTSLVSIEVGQRCFGGYNYNGGASSFSLIGIIEWMKWEIDLPQLQSVRLGEDAFYYVQSIVFESDWMDGLMIQICLYYNQFNLVVVLFVVILVMIERRLATNPTTTITH